MKRTPTRWTLEFVRFADAVHYRNAEYGDSEVQPDRLEIKTTDEGAYSIVAPFASCSACGHVPTGSMTRKQAAAFIDRVRLMVAHAQGEKKESLSIPSVELCKNGEKFA